MYLPCIKSYILYIFLIFSVCDIDISVRLRGTLFNSKLTPLPSTFQLLFPIEHYNIEKRMPSGCRDIWKILREHELLWSLLLTKVRLRSDFSTYAAPILHLVVEKRCKSRLSFRNTVCTPKSQLVK